MSREPIQLDQLRVAAPCDVGWADMRGDDRVRFCELCKLNVYYIAAMSRREATRLIQRHEGRLCVSLFRRKDGTILTRECPVGLRAWRRRTARILWAAGAFAALLSQLLAHLTRQDAHRIRVRTLQPFEAACTWLSPAAPPPAFTPLGDKSDGGMVP